MITPIEYASIVACAPKTETHDEYQVDIQAARVAGPVIVSIYSTWPGEVTWE